MAQRYDAIQAVRNGTPPVEAVKHAWTLRAQQAQREVAALTELAETLWQSRYEHRWLEEVAGGLYPFDEAVEDLADEHGAPCGRVAKALREVLARWDDPEQNFSR